MVIDYAHTPGRAREGAGRACAPSSRPGAGCCCVFGCGGDRDAGKRPLMGEAAARLADHVIVTSDNPRSEDPHAIIDDGDGRASLSGSVEVDRGPRRWRSSPRSTRPGRATSCSIAGKGHETYQEIAGERHPFSDAEVALAALEARPR